MASYDTTEGHSERRRRERVPRYASPWMEMGRLKERERCQAFTAKLMQSAISSEVEKVKRAATMMPPPPATPSNRAETPATRVPPPHPGRQLLLELVDSTKDNISSLLLNYIKMLTPESEGTHGDESNTEK